MALKEKIVNYFEDISREMKKVSWPSREELVESTKIVIIVSIILSVATWIVDSGITQVLKVVIR